MRRGIAIGIAAVVVAVGAGLGVSRLAEDGDDADEGGFEPRPYDRAWDEVAPSPLSARTNAEAFWTGEEVLVLGGHDDRHCPDCGGEGALPDGAAYDPATDRWRPLADLPEDLWRGTTELIPAGGQLFARTVRGRVGHLRRYDPTADAWSQVDLDRVEDLALLDGGDRVLAVRRCACPDDPPQELVLEVAGDRWAPLPPDPFPEAPFASIAVVGGAVYRFGGTEVAVLRPGADRWQVLDTDGPRGHPGEPVVVADLIVFTEQPIAIDTPDTHPPVAFAFDTGTEAWVDLPELTEPMASGAAVADDDTLWFGNQVLDADTLTWSDGAYVPDTALGAETVWIDDRWFAFGGQTDRGLTRRAFTWVPPD